MDNLFTLGSWAQRYFPEQGVTEFTFRIDMRSVYHMSNDAKRYSPDGGETEVVVATQKAVDAAWEMLYGDLYRKLHEVERLLNTMIPPTLSATGGFPPLGVQELRKTLSHLDFLRRWPGGFDVPYAELDSNGKPTGTVTIVSANGEVRDRR